MRQPAAQPEGHTGELRSGFAPFLLMIGFTAALPRDSHFGPGVYTGLIGRLLLLSYLG